MPKVNKRNHIYISVAMLLTFAAMALFMMPHTEEQMRRNMTLVECRSYCEIRIDGRSVLYLDRCPDDWTEARILPAGGSIPYHDRIIAGQWTYRYKFIPVCDGTVTVAETCTEEQRRAAEFNKNFDLRIDEGINKLTRKRKRLKRVIAELKYYLGIHNVRDEGYNTIAEYAEKAKSDFALTDSIIGLLKGIKGKNNAKMYFACKYTLLYNTDGTHTRRIACDLIDVNRNDRTCTLQTHDRQTPENAYPVFIGNPLRNYSFTPKSASASSLFNAGGLLTGYGTATDSSSVYTGQWKNGKRHGYGILSYPAGKRKVVGLWNADTITDGVITDGHGVYKGGLNKETLAEGHGIMKEKDGGCHDGYWASGKRDGFGCATDSVGNLRAGEWKDGLYKGERLLYTSERIYGIDISRHQHEKGRKRYSINWKNVRITHLGNISRKKVSGSISYPVSFVYIKSTEGISVRNRYYISDYKLARRNGIRCGAYHFFSPTSDAKKQAYYFLRHSRFSKGDFPPVLDVEPTSRQVTQMGGPQAMFRKIRAWLNIVHSRTGIRPILYVNQQFVNRYLPLAPDIKSGYKIWIARYGEYKPDIKLVFWQLCPDGRVSGIHGDVDINVFNGYSDRYGQFLQNETFK